MPGDNLASQFLGGYKALNSSLRKCRHCMATAEEIFIEGCPYLRGFLGGHGSWSSDQDQPRALGPAH